MILDPVETRVLACLIEKSVTTPEYYPLTLNALTAACNQKSNRDPVMQVTDAEVGRALESLREKKVAWSVTMAGSRAPKFRHSLTDVLPVTPAQQAVLCELMLRGAQTAGELRARAARMVPAPEGVEAAAALQALQEWAGGALVARLPRQPGQREERFAHLLGGEAAPAAPAAPDAGQPGTDAEGDAARLAALEARVSRLEAELARLRAPAAETAPL